MTPNRVKSSGKENKSADMNKQKKQEDTTSLNNLEVDSSFAITRTFEAEAANRTQEAANCPLGIKVFTRAYSLKNHGEAVHIPPGKYVCDICKKEFTRKAYLVNHIARHTSKKQFACNLCTKTFVVKADLNQHVILHWDAKRFSCQLCNKSFSQRSHLARHKIIHLGIKPYVCKECNKGYSDKSALRSHMTINHTPMKDKEEFKCEICLKIYSSKPHLKRHLVVHIGVKEHFCDGCGKSFFYRSDLLVHYRVCN